MRLILLVVLVLLGNANPIIMWGKDFSENGAQLFEAVDAKKIVETFVDVIKPKQKQTDSFLRSFFRKNEVPEVIVFFARDVESLGEYSTVLNMYNENAKSQFSSLRKNIIEGIHGGSIVMPYCSVENAFVSIVNPLAQSGLDSKAKKLVFNAKKDDLFLNKDFVEVKQLEDSTIYSNKITDIIVVKLNDEEDTLEKVDNLIFEKTNGNYLGVLSFELVTKKQQQHSSKNVKVEEKEQIIYVRQVAAVSANSTDTAPRPPTYFPTMVWGWLFVSFFLFYFFLSSVLSLKNVQVPPKLLSIEQVKHKKLN